MLVESLIDPRGRTHTHRPVAIAGVFVGHMIAASLLIVVPLLTNARLPSIPSSLSGLVEPLLPAPPPADDVKLVRTSPPSGGSPSPGSHPALVAPRDDNSTGAEQDIDLGLGVNAWDDTGPSGPGSNLIGPPIGPVGPSGAPPAPAAAPSAPRVQAPRLLHSVEPGYPDFARHGGIQGTVVLEATTDATGHVIEVRVLKSIRFLDDAAVAAVRQWVYEPVRINGQSHAVVFVVTVIFRLDRAS